MKKTSAIILLSVIILSACTERVQIDLDETYTRLVVYSNITSDTTTHYVELSESTSYYYNQPPPPVTGASVRIEVSDGSSITLEEVKPGIYATPPNYYAKLGHTYNLNITLQEPINESSVYSAKTTCGYIYPIDSIALKFQKDWGEKGYYEVQCWYQDPSTKEFYMFDIYKNGDHLTDTITNRAVSDDEFYNGSYTNGIGVGYLDQAYDREIVNPGDTIVFRAGIIDEDYANFLWTLQEEAGFSTPLFSGPPANVKGNIDNGAIGYFAVFGVAYSSTIKY